MDLTFIMYLDVVLTAEMTDGRDCGQARSWVNLVTTGLFLCCVNVWLIQNMERIVKLSGLPFFSLHHQCACGVSFQYIVIEWKMLAESHSEL